MRKLKKGSIVALNKKAFLISDYLASGKFSHVYKIENLLNKKEYAFKMIGPSLSDKQFKNEIKCMTKVKFLVKG